MAGYGQAWLGDSHGGRVQGTKSTATWCTPHSELTMHLRDLQAKLPWAIPYTDAFRFSQDHEHHRNLIHDVLHVQKSLGKIANYCEQLDHNDRLLHPDYLLARRDALACEVVDLVICALHMAKTNPFGPFDLESEVLSALDRRNGSNLMEQEGHRP